MLNYLGSFPITMRLPFKNKPVGSELIAFKASNSAAVRGWSMISTLYYMIPDLILLGFLSYNFCFHRDRVVWVRSQYGLSFGVALDLRINPMPFLFAGLQVIIDIALLSGIALRNRKLMIPSITYHAMRCVLLFGVVIALGHYLPQITHVLTTVFGTAPIKTIASALISLLTIEILAWLGTVIYYHQLSEDSIYFNELHLSESYSM